MRHKEWLRAGKCSRKNHMAEDLFYLQDSITPQEKKYGGGSKLQGIKKQGGGDWVQREWKRRGLKD